MKFENYDEFERWSRENEELAQEMEGETPYEISFGGKIEFSKEKYSLLDKEYEEIIPKFTNYVKESNKIH